MCTPDTDILMAKVLRMLLQFHLENIYSCYVYSSIGYSANIFTSNLPMLMVK